MILSNRWHSDLEKSFYVSLATWKKLEGIVSLTTWKKQEGLGKMFKVILDYDVNQVKVTLLVSGNI
ncbi:hypothetical protein CUMW_221150 [Citrus unshiu]|uniref:Uncharacterized protein n=1 Tax=Citrus unshiu TaxID=55188 RepID=A0A2H5QE43_CITUN|nr:hypothetical protein CUMW_221150 [Citrus unshiu]